MRVSIIGTVHAESGQASVRELAAILEGLRPDVIFAEIPSSYVDRYCDGSHGTLEALAVVDYRTRHDIPVIPVDLPKPEDGFFRNAEDMFATVERTSPDYRHIIDRHTLDIRVDGFPYLNSDRCIQALTDIHNEVMATLDWIGQPRLREIYHLWGTHLELRDREMVNNISDYAVRNGFVHGVFLVGTAHRKSVIEKAQMRSGTGWGVVVWELGAPSLGSA